MLNVFVGFDPVETVAYNVLQHSIQEQCSQPVHVVPIRLSQLKGIFARPRDPLQSTDFSFSRFLTPYLSGYQGWSLFMDCDVLVRDDLTKLWELRKEDFAVQVVKHDHRPTEATKFLGNTQTQYAKKNWSSVMLFNNARCTRLTPEYVSTATGLELHQFKWLESDDQIGELPARYNHLVGYNEPNPDAAIVHFTEGGPYFPEYADCEFAKEWFAQRDSMLFVKSR